ncbi:MAG: hypothetical protein M1817_004330 [Caeruleum heppii]|nr:MAG: hypothetical protein M1817_004330 [Caeruleum heppii]
MRPILGDALGTIPRPGAALSRYLIVAVVVVIVFSWYSFRAGLPSPSSYLSPAAPSNPTAKPQSPSSSEPGGRHPIDLLIERADGEFYSLLRKESKDVFAAAAAYRERRGRHPPPGFQAWFDFAQNSNAVIIEEFFDQIYHDLEPFWGLPARRVRKDAHDFDSVNFETKERNEYPMVITVRQGKAEVNNGWFWAQIWHSLVHTIEGYLPDMDIPINSMDESRLVVPFEDISEYIKEAESTRRMPDPSEMKSEYSGLQDVDTNDRTNQRDPEWEVAAYPYYTIGRRGCHPESLARKAEVMKDWTKSPSISMQHAGPHSYKGYVSNWTLATSICHQPDLQALHGYLIEPLTIRSSKHMIPLFGGSKLATNNEILLPAPMYWSDDKRFQADDYGPPWTEKTDTFIWRGVGSGGRNKADNWKGFHRQRFVSMMNGTSVTRAENWEELPVNYELPSRFYDLKAARNGHLGDWVGGVSDIGIVDPFCFPKEAEVDGTCSYYDRRIFPVMGMDMNNQFKCKYLPDIDGNSFSGRYRAFLLSNSVPIKATIFKEWHDSRIMPWKHFVPLDNRFQDIYGIMEYFLGYSGFNETEPENTVGGHDAVAQRIAMAGQEWANKVLRREDMQIYVFRLLLEYARVSDDERDHLGYVADLTG